MAARRRGKANLYDAGTRVPLAVCWPARIRGELAGRVLDDLVFLTDLAPTFIEMAGLRPPVEMTGRSLLARMLGEQAAPVRDAVFLQRERHANVRRGDLNYPARAIRTADWLYIRNLRPGRWPAGDPELWEGRWAVRRRRRLADEGLHPRAPRRAGDRSLLPPGLREEAEEELYDVANDPGQLTNLAASPEHAEVKAGLRRRVAEWMRATADTRLAERPEDLGGAESPGSTAPWDSYPYFGGGPGWRGRPPPNPSRRESFRLEHVKSSRGSPSSRSAPGPEVS